MFLVKRQLSSRTNICCSVGFWFCFCFPNKLYKNESAGKMALKFHISLLDHFFLRVASAKQENSLELSPPNRKTFSLCGF